MTDIILERVFTDPLAPSEVISLVEVEGDCFKTHRVEWINSFLSTDGHKLVCWFNAPDAESARLALKQANVDMSVCWPFTLHSSPDNADLATNVLVARSWDEPVEIDEIQAIEDKGAWCLENWRVKFVQTFFSLDQKRMLCLYNAPDAEAVRQAQRQAQMPVDDIWSIKPILG